MSWFSKNYEKTALGAAVLLALGLVGLGWSKLGGVDEAFNPEVIGKGSNDTAVAGADLIPKAMQSMKLDRTWAQEVVDGRPVDTFTGIPLFIKSSDPEKPVDLFTAPPVHPPIPNLWWIENRLDPGFADSPNRDPDADGFSNMEEFLAKTDPNNNKSIPALIAKLMYVKDESVMWLLRPGYGDGGSFPFSYEDTKGGLNKTPPGQAIAPNGLFFANKTMAKRFKLLGSEVRRALSKNVNIEVEVTIVRVEDQRPNKIGQIYELPSPLPLDRKNEHVKYDRTAVLSLEAIGESGKEFKVEENTTFALPPSSPKKDYLLKKVSPESITVEFTDAQGTLKTVDITKGGLPKSND